MSKKIHPKVEFTTTYADSSKNGWTCVLQWMSQIFCKFIKSEAAFWKKTQGQENEW